MHHLPVSATKFALRLLALVALAVAALNLAAQTTTQKPDSNAEIQSHFAAAQQAQRQKDYATAEKEYKSVIAVAPEFAEVHMNLGLVYQLQNRYPEAMTEFRRALKLKPALTGANFFMGVDYCKMGEGQKAVPYLKTALKASPNQPEIWLWLATAQEISGDIDAEVATMREALASQPKDVDLLYLLGHAYERLGKQEVAHMEKIAPESFRKEQFLAESYAASNEWPSAVIHFQNALAASPHQSGLHVELGEVLLHAGKVKQAALEFEAELQLNPQSLRALVRRGEIELIQENIDSALKDWTQAIAIDELQVERILGLRESGFGDSSVEQLPSSLLAKIEPLSAELRNKEIPAGRVALAFLAVQSGNPAQVADGDNPAGLQTQETSAGQSCSEADMNLLLRQDRFSQIAFCAQPGLPPRTSAELRTQVVSALLQAGDYEAALRTLDGLPATESKSLEAFYWRARCYEKLATAAYLRLYEANPNSYRWHQLMGDIAAAKGDDGKAIEEYRAAVLLKPSLPNLHYSLGHLLWKDLKVPEARIELEAELASNPHHAGALTDLGDTYLLEHQPEKALPYLNSALAADAGNSDIHRDLGTAYSELGDYHKAEEELKIAVTADHDGSVHYKLARAYQALGQKENASREFALSTSLNRESHNKLEKQTERLAAITNSTQDP
ncbi:MAG TPA: tetratricopeptide repeat protein [Candidatus Acidoferrum sp.]|nr:tetratricopeptide repeat protein [Candidatus Acidoferrum sp.]